MQTITNEEFNNLSNRELCDKYNISKSTLYRWANKQGLSRCHGAWHELDKEQFKKDAMVLGLKDLGAKYNVSKSTAGLWKIKLGIESDTGHLESSYDQKRKKWEPHLGAIEEAVKNNLGAKWLSDKTGLSYDSCRWKLKTWRKEDEL